MPRVNLDLEARLCRLLPPGGGGGAGQGGPRRQRRRPGRHRGGNGPGRRGRAEAVPALAGTPRFWLFSESPGAVAVAVEPGDLAAFRELAREHEVPVAELGRVSAEPELVIGDLIRLSLAEMERAWTGTLAEVFCRCVS